MSIPRIDENGSENGAPFLAGCRSEYVVETERVKDGVLVENICIETIRKGIVRCVGIIILLDSPRCQANRRITFQIP